eukprot:m.247042 g.247042  ORF g.247042 m.247042 type:complete len:758 (-) comp16125_c1_seq2:194-2467(-)
MAIKFIENSDDDDKTEFMKIYHEKFKTIKGPNQNKFKSSLVTKQTKTEEVISEFNNYCNCGKLLGQVPVYRSIQKAYQEQTPNAMPFVLLDGPSGVGKTQQFFALGDLKLIYVVMGSSPNAQSIYKAFEPISFAFQSCISADLDNLSEVEQEMLSTHTFAGHVNTLFQTAGLLIALLKYLKDATTSLQCLQMQSCVGKTNEIIEYEAATVQSLENELAHHEIPKPFVVAIDEVPTSGPPTDTKTLFSRSLLRYCGFVVVMCGTNSSAKNAVCHSRTTDDGKLQVWAYGQTRTVGLSMISLNARFPQLQNTLGLLDAGLQKAYHHLLCNNRPLLAVYLAEALLQDKQNFDDVIDDVACRLFRSKSGLRTYFGLTGQMAMTMKAMQLCDKTDNQFASQLVVKHMAYLDFEKKKRISPFRGDSNEDPGAVFSVKCHGDNLQLVVNDSSEEWSAFSHYPSVEEECLLFLSLLGTKSECAFVDPNNSSLRLSTFKAISQKPRRREALMMAHMPVINTSAAKSDGTLLEAITTTAMCISSHENGVNGSPLQQFVGNLCRECLQVSMDRKSEWTMQVIGLDKLLPKKEWKNMIVPYMFPPMIESPTFPECLNILGSFAILDRPPDREKIDILVQHSGATAAKNYLRLSGEDKDYKNHLDKSNLDQILERVPPDRHVEFIFCNSINAGAYTRAHLNKRVATDLHFNQGGQWSKFTLAIAAPINCDAVEIKPLNKYTIGNNPETLVIVVPITQFQTQYNKLYCLDK